MHRPLLAVLLGLLFAPALAAPAAAGQGPETTLVVVNDDSPLSKQVANAYVTRRGIDPTHVCRLAGIPNLRVIGIDVFRERILVPVRAYVEAHGLADVIDTVAYAPDFPYGVNYDADFEDETLPKGVHKFRVASLTGLTYLHELVMERDRDWLDLRGKANRYVRIVARSTSMEILPAHGYRRAYRWSDAPTPDLGPDAEGRGGYFLSTLLGASGIQGNTTAEILACLESAAAVDATRPEGTVYLMKSGNVRAKTRAGFFEQTQNMLQALDRRCVVLEQGEDGQDGKVPVGKDDVLGCVAGTAGFNWAKAKSRLLPGSIAEHLTSFGARLDGSGQTKCTEFVRAGAAGTAGAVAEPYAIWMKFPLPFLHAHYAEGCALAEVFYQNVVSPYQLLVLGDPLARPFARLGTVAVDGAPRGAWAGTVRLEVGATIPGDEPVGAVEAWVDGRRVASGPPETPLEIDTTALEDGGHTLRVVAVEGTRLETRSSTVRRIEVENGERRVTLRVPRRPVPLGEEVVLKGRARGAKTVDVRLGATVLGTDAVRAGRWRLEVPAARLGIGRVAVVARATYAEGPCVRSPIEDVEIEPPERIEAPRSRGGDHAEGLRATVVDKKGASHTLVVTFVGKLRKNHFAKEVGAKVPGRPRSITLEGEMRAPADGLYRLAINAAGTLRIDLSGETVFAGEGLAMDRQAYAAVALEKGWHPVEVAYEPTGAGDLWILLGGARVSAFLGGGDLRHETD